MTVPAMPSKKGVAAVAREADPVSEPPAGWTRYFDPGAQRTYLYCDDTGEWFFEAAVAAVPAAPAASEDPKSAVAEQMPLFGLSVARPSAPPVPEAPPEAPPASASVSSRDSAVQELAKVDPIVQDLLRDELKLKKKLREISALEVASQERQLEATQLTKLSKKDAIVSDLELVQVHIAEALQEFKSRRPIEPDTRRPAPKPKSKQSQGVQPGLNPLPQRGKAPLPVDPRIANMRLGNSASRHPTLAGYAGSTGSTGSTVPAQSAASSGERPGPRTAAVAPKAGLPARVQPAAPQSVGPDEDGFVAVRKGAKPKKGPTASAPTTTPMAPDDDAFW